MFGVMNWGLWSRAWAEVWSGFHELGAPLLDLGFIRSRVTEEELGAPPSERDGLGAGRLRKTYYATISSGTGGRSCTCGGRVSERGVGSKFRADSVNWVPSRRLGMTWGLQRVGGVDLVV